MATVHYYVDTAASSGGDGTTSATTGTNRAFHSLGNAITAVFAAYPNFVTSTVNPVIHCAASTGVADSAPSTFPTFTSNATYYLTIQVDSAVRHSGIYNTSKYRIEANAGAIYDKPPAYTRFIGLQSLNTQDDLNVYHWWLNSVPGCRIISCIARFVDKNYTYGTQTYVAPGVDMLSSPTIITNCLFYGGNGTHGHAGSSAIAGPNAGVNSYIVAYNNTIIGFGAANDATSVGIVDGYSKVTAYNNIVIGYSSFGNPAFAKDYNVSDLATTTYLGTHGRASQTVIFVDATSSLKNYNLDLSDAAAKGYGTNLSADATYPFTDDIAGNTRSDPWDVGAFAFVAGGGTATSASVAASGSSVTASVGTVTVTAITSGISRTVNVTGSIATTALGTALASAKANKYPSGVNAQSNTGTVVIAGTDVIRAIGVQATSAIGQVAVSANNITAVVGLSASIQLGNESPVANANTYPSGQIINTAVGSVSIGNIGNASLNPAGVQSVSSIGSPNIHGNSNEYLIGNQAISAIGTVSVNTSGNSAVTTSGVNAVGSIGMLSIHTTANVNSVGVSAVGQIGIVTDSDSGNVIPVGVQATGQVGNVSAVIFNSTAVNPSGISVNAGVGSVSVASITYARPNGVELTGSVGTVQPYSTSNVSINGLFALTSINPVAVDGGSTVLVTGIQAQTALGTVQDRDSANVTISGVEAVSRVGSATVGLLGPAIVDVTGVQAVGQLGLAYIPGEPVNTFPVGVQASCPTPPGFCLAISNNNAVASTVVSAGGPRHGGGFGTFMYQAPVKPKATVSNARVTVLPSNQAPSVSVSGVKIGDLNRSNLTLNRSRSRSKTTFTTGAVE